MKDSEVPRRGSTLGRRDFIKVGAGASACVNLLTACGTNRLGAVDKQVHENPVQRVLPKFKWGSASPGGGGGLQRGPGYRFYRIVPNDVMEISIGLELGEYDRESVNKAIERYWPAVEALAKQKVDVIILGGAPVSAQLGRARVRKLLDDTKRRTGIPADAPLEAALAGMAHLGVKKVAVGSRWTEQMNQAVVDYLREGGVQVLAITSRGQTVRDVAPDRMSFEEGLQSALELAYEAARKAPEADGLLMPGGIMAEHVIVPIEEEFRKPVFTNLNAEVWNNLVRTKVIPPIQGWGRLLATP